MSMEAAAIRQPASGAGLFILSANLRHLSRVFVLAATCAFGKRRRASDDEDNPIRSRTRADASLSAHCAADTVAHLGRMPRRRTMKRATIRLGLSLVLATGWWVQR